jgi:c-di-GMP-binding flagellar brake protein YcgR
VIIEKALKINSKIEIAIVNDEESPSFAQSLIQEVSNDSFSIMVPMHNGHALYLAEGDEVVVSLLFNSIRYSYKTKVLGKKKEREINLVVLKNPQQLTTSDRRNLVRIKTLLPIKYEIINYSNIDKWENIVPSNEAYITDLKD